MLYFGDPWPNARSCKTLYRVDITENQYLKPAFWAAPADRWDPKGWVPAPDAQRRITEWENELWEISEDQLGQAMVSVLEWRGVAQAQIEDALRREGVALPDPETTDESERMRTPEGDADAAAELLPTGLDIVYAKNDGRGGALFAVRRIAKVAADKCRAVTESKTWGQFRAKWPDDHFDEDYGYPPDDAPFGRSQLPPLGEGFPEDPWLPDYVVSWFPDDLQEKYGCEVRFTSEGSDLYVPPEHADAIAEELRARGNRVEESDGDLQTWTAYWY